MRPATTFQPASPGLRRRLRCPPSTAVSTSARANPSCRALSRAWSVQLTEAGSVDTAPQATDELSHLCPGTPRFGRVATRSVSAPAPAAERAAPPAQAAPRSGPPARVRVSFASRLPHSATSQVVVQRRIRPAAAQSGGRQCLRRTRAWLTSRTRSDQGLTAFGAIRVAPGM
jgi:hypothetical protein